MSKSEPPHDGEENGGALEKRGNGMWAPFTPETASMAAQRRIQYQRELKARAREELYRQAEDRVRESVEFQQAILRKASDPDYLMDKDEARKNKLGLDVTKDTLDRLVGKASVHVEIEQADGDVIDLDDAWVVDESDDVRELEEKSEG